MTKGGNTVASELEKQLASLKQGDHVCLIYESTAGQSAVVVPFIKEGLARGERCLYAADRTVEEVVQALTAAGVDVAQESQRGAPRLLTVRAAPQKVTPGAEGLPPTRAVRAGGLGWRERGFWLFIPMTWSPGHRRFTRR
ncbi:MAG: Sensory box histidine kinase [Gemmataceae bacterium]|nr:Sensory box histidine kinase [Gemmataceae bacterium]